MKKILSLIMALCMLGTLCIVYAVDDVPTAGDAPTAAADALLAFPGAEGGGKYTKGARGALDAEGGRVEVYHVTNLDATGEGSFSDAVGNGVQEDDSATVGRIVVFDVGGIIEVPGTVYVNRNNITILGQTAPGDGITITGGDVRIGNARQNVIMRYLRVRPTNKNGGEYDGIGGQWNKDVIIDHCSTSWFVDEGMTLYAGNAENSNGYEQGQRLTVQNSITAESMRLSGHFKGAHGYGGIIGGTNATYYRNLWAHHDSRSPRLDRALQKTDFRNNIVYNWGVTNSAYGGEPCSPHNQVINPSKVNYANNFYSFGPSTREDRKPRIYDFDGLAKTIDGVTYKSQFYMEDNYVEGYSDVTANNWLDKAVNKAANQVDRMTAPFSLGDDLYSDLNLTSILPGKDVRDSVLSDVGATLPKRDAVDARIIADAANRTGRIINNSSEVGGISGFEKVEQPFEIPAQWKTDNGMGDADETDIVSDGAWKGYTWIEAYVNDWTQQQSATAPANPSITVTSPAIASVNGSVNGVTVNKGNWSVIKEDQTVSYKAQATPVGGTSITKMELWDGETKIKDYDGQASIDDAVSLDVGEHYLSCMAYNNLGESTRSTTSIVYVNGANQPEGWSFKAIGSPTYGSGGVSVDENGIYTIGGSGKIGGKTDKFNFMYKQVTGDFDISLKMEDVMANENGPVFGLMVRNTLDANSISAALVDGWIKLGRNPRIVARKTKGGELATDENQTNSTDKKTGIFFTDKNGGIISANVLGEYNDGNKKGYNWLPGEAHELPNYLRIQRSGKRLIFSVSNDGVDYTDNIRQPYIMEISGLSDTVYVGVAIDSHQGQSDASPKPYYSMATFSDLKLDDKSNYVDPEPTETPEPTEPPAPVDPELAEKYGKWLVGIADPTKDDGELSITTYEGKGALEVVKRNAYMPLSSAISSGKVDFDFDLYIDTEIDRNFRVYLENGVSKATVSDNVFAEVINNFGGKVTLGPEINEQNKTLFTYEQLGESQWVNFNMTLDYDKVGTEEFITLTAKRDNGDVLASVNIGSIEGRDATLRSIRLVQTADVAYFANMELTKEFTSTDVFYAEAPALESGTVTASVQNNGDEGGALLIAAAYSSGMIVDAKAEKIPKGTDPTQVSLTFDKPYTDVKLYLLSGLSLMPYSNVIKLK